MSDPAPVRIVLHGAHVPKARPRLDTGIRKGRRTHKPRVHMPDGYKDCVSSYRQQMRSAFRKDPWPQYTPLRLEVHRYVRRPGSKPDGVPPEVWADGRAFICTTAKGDCDNIAGTVMDAGNGVLWYDDSQIAPLWCCKVYMADDDPEGERVVMMVTEMGWFG